MAYDNLELLEELLQILEDVTASVKDLELNFKELCGNLSEEAATTDMEDWEKYTVVDTVKVIRQEAKRLKALFTGIVGLCEQSEENEETETIGGTGETEITDFTTSSFKTLASLALASSPLELIEETLEKAFKQMDLGESDTEEDESQDLIMIEEIHDLKKSMGKYNRLRRASTCAL